MSQNYKSISEERKSLQKSGDLPEWYTTGAYQTFKQKYAVPGESGIRERFTVIANTLAAHLPKSIQGEYAIKFFNVMWRGWLSPASPVLANTGTKRGFNVSCSGGVVADSIDGFYDQLHEQAILSKYGFGCSADFSDVRARGADISVGGKSTGVVHVIEDFATMASRVSQGSSRRGSTASYVNIEHGDFDELLDTLEQSPDGLNIGWVITDEYIEKLKIGDVEAQRRYTRALYCKLVTGKGYFFFIDKVNRARPETYKKLGKFVKASNLCNEIRLHADSGAQGSFDSDDGGHSFSCVLSSMNVYKYDEWKDTDAVFVATVFLDCVVSDFLKNSYGVNGLQRVHRFTRKSRPIGLGQLGFQSYLQSKMIPFESLEAYYLNDEIAKKIWDDSLTASKWLAQELGEPEWCKGSGVRNTHRIACAPNKTSSQLMGGVSESFSPEPAMVFIQGSSVGEVSRVSPEFLKLLKRKNKYDDDVIKSVINNVGSCQHLDFLSDDEKEVFKTAFEIDQMSILKQASRRQKYIDQGQSVNLYVSADGDEDRISELHRYAFLDENIHGLYYVYSQSGVVVNSVCSACEG